MPFCYLSLWYGLVSKLFVAASQFSNNDFLLNFKSDASLSTNLTDMWAAQLKLISQGVGMQSFTAVAHHR